MSITQPNYPADVWLYEKLCWEHTKRPLTEDEKKFCSYIYHMEEYASGLDGDRE